MRGNPLVRRDGKRSVAITERRLSAADVPVFSAQDAVLTLDSIVRTTTDLQNFPELPKLVSRGKSKSNTEF